MLCVTPDKVQADNEIFDGIPSPARAADDADVDAAEEGDAPAEERDAPADESEDTKQIRADLEAAEAAEATRLAAEMARAAEVQKQEKKAAMVARTEALRVAWMFVHC